MTTKHTQLTFLAKQNMDSADKMHDDLCKKYGETSDVAMYALQSCIATFVIYCELERLEMGD